MKCKCERCGVELNHRTRRKIMCFKFVRDPQVSGELARTVWRFSLCQNCYKEFRDPLKDFLHAQKEVSE